MSTARNEFVEKSNLCYAEVSGIENWSGTSLVQGGWKYWNENGQKSGFNISRFNISNPPVCTFETYGSTRKALNTEEKLIIVLVFLILGMIGYAVCEVVDKSRSKVEEVTEELKPSEKADLEADL